VDGEGEGDGEGKSSPFVGGPGPSLSSSCMLSLPSHVSSPHVLVVSSFHVGIALWGSLVVVPCHCCCPCSGHIVVLCLSQVGWDELRGVLTMVP